MQGYVRRGRERQGGGGKEEGIGSQPEADLQLPVQSQSRQTEQARRKHKVLAKLIRVPIKISP